MIDWVKVENTQECKRLLKIRHVIQCCKMRKKEQKIYMKNHPHRISRVGQLSIQFIFYTYTLRKKAFNTINASNDWLEIIQWNLYILTFFHFLTMMATNRRFFSLFIIADGTSNSSTSVSSFRTGKGEWLWNEKKRDLNARIIHCIWYWWKL